MFVCLFVSNFQYVKCYPICTPGLFSNALPFFSLKHPLKSFPYLSYFVHYTCFSSNEKRWYHLYKKIERLHTFIWKGKKILDDFFCSEAAKKILNLNQHLGLYQTFNRIAYRLENFKASASFYLFISSLL